ncbi:MAG: 30S ribosomal protein S7 [Candidatus Doudnabacteria bacterium]
MPRRSRSVKRHTPSPDPKFSSVKYAKFINYLMERGKKTVAQKIFYDALEIVETKAASAAKNDNDAKSEITDSRQIFDIALKNVCPIMEVKGRRIGGSNYQVPMEVQEPRKTALGMKWMIKAAKSRKGAPMKERLAGEILDAFNKVGAAVKKREDSHRMADANKAFAHFARFTSKKKK